jgi:biotin--protein ligase
VLGVWGNSVRLKWPNDVYGVFGEGDTDRKKIGGILISITFRGDEADIVVGKCGSSLSLIPVQCSSA